MPTVPITNNISKIYKIINIPLHLKHMKVKDKEINHVGVNTYFKIPYKIAIQQLAKPFQAFCCWTTYKNIGLFTYD